MEPNLQGSTEHQADCAFSPGRPQFHEFLNLAPITKFAEGANKASSASVTFGSDSPVALGMWSAGDRNVGVAELHLSAPVPKDAFRRNLFFLTFTAFSIETYKHNSWFTFQGPRPHKYCRYIHDGPYPRL